jgi:AmmeMemoRadiSam system protein A
VDKTFLAALERFDSGYIRLTENILLSHGEAGLECAACGSAAIIAGMEAAKALGANRTYVTAYDNSGAGAETERAVGYGAAAFSKSAGPAKFEWKLSGDEKKILLKTARAAVSSYILKSQFDSSLRDIVKLNLPAAVFVTITKDSSLRGCVGTTEPQGTLYESAAYFARAAAFADKRFAPVEKAELEKLHYEISVLSRPEPVASADGIKPKIHGVIVSLKGHTGLFLPQVWDVIGGKEEFLSELCGQKAGLARDCWKDPEAKLSVFTVESFGENEAG